MSTKRSSKDISRHRRSFALKVALEQPFKKELRENFDRIKNVALARYRRGKESLSASNFNFKTESLLKKQYRRTSNSFKDEARLYAAKKSFEIKQLEDDINKNINTALSVYIPTEAEKSARIIDDTTVKNISDSFSESRAELEESNKEQTVAAISALAGIKMIQKFYGRVEGIAMTETQKMAETTKYTEAAAISTDGQSNVSPSGFLSANPSVDKKWFATLDQKTRAAHVSASGQTVSINEPFVVGGEMLKYPGDSSLGASASNVINCRCDSLYTS
jgi:hypothetical protein